MLWYKWKIFSFLRIIDTIWSFLSSFAPKNFPSIWWKRLFSLRSIQFATAKYWKVNLHTKSIIYRFTNSNYFLLTFFQFLTKNKRKKLQQKNKILKSSQKLKSNTRETKEMSLSIFFPMKFANICHLNKDDYNHSSFRWAYNCVLCRSNCYFFFCAHSNNNETFGILLDEIMNGCKHLGST